MSISRFLMRLLLGRRLPITSGELRIRGLTHPITIRRDNWGVPHIDSTTDADAYFALGFCQGQDRAGQLEVMFRLAAGRLAEWVGAVALPADRMSRRIGFRRAAQAQYRILRDDVRTAFDAFVAGVNAGATEGLSAKPHEFAIVGGTPTAWDTADVLALLKLQSFLLPSNWDVELARLRILLADGPDAVRELDPVPGVCVRDFPNVSASTEVVEHFASDLRALQSYLTRGGGSNNWVISGARTQSGKPLLASDPHLGPTCPPPWYLAHVRTPQWEVAGAALAGTLGFPIGHNGHLAWGVTAGLTDNSDLFIETLQSADARSVREADGSFSVCQVVKETIRVKNAAEVTEEVVITPRGPLVSPLIPDAKHAISLSAIWLEPRPLVGFLHAPQSRSFDELRKPFAEWPALPLNLLCADSNNNIGWQLVGEVPLRRGRHGLLPRPADTPNTGWNGTVPFDSMPMVANPDCGYLATANDEPVSPRAWLGADYVEHYRAQRIRELLASRDSGWTLAECSAIQLDIQSVPWTDIRDSVLSLSPQDRDASEALQLLRDWDGRVDANSPAATLFELFLAEMCIRVAKVKAPRAWEVAIGEGAFGVIPGNLFSDRRVSHFVRLVKSQATGWFVSWAAEMESVLAVVVRKLRREVGPSSAYWAWGHLRQLLLEHPLFGKQRVLRGIFNRGPVPWGGDSNTVSQAGARPADPTAYTHNIANLRTAFDLADLSKSTFVLCGGQSGNPLSQHHADQFPLWLQGESFVMPWEQTDVIRAAVDTLRLLPN